MSWWKRIRRKRRVGPEWYRENGRVLGGFHWGGTVVARVRGRTSAYVVSGSPKALDCTCEARQLPCPHVLAVQMEWEENASGFVDLESRIASLPPGEAGSVRAFVEANLHSRPGRILDVTEKDGLIRLANAS